jgi:hypothetical protein
MHAFGIARRRIEAGFVNKLIEYHTFYALFWANLL